MVDQKDNSLSGGILEMQKTRLKNCANKIILSGM